MLVWVLRANDQLDVLCLGKNFNLMRIFFFFLVLAILVVEGQRDYYLIAESSHVFA